MARIPALAWASSLLASAGVFVSGNLALAHYREVDLPCGSGGGCEAVARDAWAAIGPVPTAAIGLAAYAAIAVLLGFTGRARTLAQVLAALGVVVSLALTGRSLLVIHQICAWCLGSALIMLLLAIALFKAPPRPASVLHGMASMGLAGVAAFGAYQFNLNQGTPLIPYNPRFLEQQTPAALAPDSSPSLGNKEAPVTLVEFADLQCSSCRSFFPRAEALVKRIPNLRLVFRHLPLTELKGHRLSGKIAGLSEVAREKGKFWEYVGKAYATERNDDLNAHLEILRGMGIDPNAALKRAETLTDAATKRVTDDVAFAEKLGLRQTPTLIVLVEGMKPRIIAQRQLAEVLQEREVLARLSGETP